MTSPRIAVLTALTLLGLLWAPPAPLSAQATAGADGGGRLTGRVLRQGSPVPQVPITLHRVSNDSSGAVATAVTDGSGAFSFALPPAGDAAFTVFFATADFLGVRYFGAPVHPSERPESYTVAVYDTASALPVPPKVGRRDVVMIPLTNGGWEIDEVVSVHNPSDLTLVGRGGLPSWEMQIPEQALEFEAGEGDICTTEMMRMENRVLLVSPLVPGTCNLFFRYLIDPQQEGLVLPVSAPTDTFNLFVRQPAPELTIQGLGTPEVINAEGESFLRYETIGLAPGDHLPIEWRVEGLPPVDPVLAGVVSAALVLLVGGGMALRMRGGGRSPGSAPARRAG